MIIGRLSAAKAIPGSARRSNVARLLAIAALTTMLCAGCQTARVAEPLTAKLAGSEADTHMEFWHQLADRPVTCNVDAFHGLLLYLD
jgi:hypothetical protein